MSRSGCWLIFWGAEILKSLSNSVNTACYVFYKEKKKVFSCSLEYIYIWVFRQFGVRLPVKLSVSDVVHTYNKRNIAHWNAKWKIPGKLIECIAVIFFFPFPFLFSLLPFNLRHVFSLLHHFSELGKNKRSLFCTFSAHWCCVFVVFFFFLLRAPFRPFVQICGWAGPRVELSAGVNLHMVLIDWLGDACESEMCINVVSCGQAFTVSDSPWKLCLWWVQTAGSPSFLIPLTPWHRRSICWADSTTTKDSEKHKIH